ncbi:MAG: cyanophycinase [Chitinophagaceae bacterium]
MYCSKLILSILILPSINLVNAQSFQPKGKLFIIGGGDRTPALMRSLMNTASMKENDYVVVLPMSSEDHDTSFTYIKNDLELACTNTIVNFNFTKDLTEKKTWLDSLEKAKLIFITGGDQDRFMKIVLNTPVYKSIHRAYKNGATIAGTSAGAAVMSKYMITGNELTDTTYRSTFRKIVDKNIEIKVGLGLLPNAVIDQHFLVRSRYNRLISALAKFPSLSCIGIDEETAIVVNGNKIRVVGNSQVIRMRKPINITITAGGLIKLVDMEFTMFTEGDIFFLDK